MRTVKRAANSMGDRRGSRRGVLGGGAGGGGGVAHGAGKYGFGGTGTSILCGAGGPAEVLAGVRGE